MKKMNQLIAEFLVKSKEKEEAEEQIKALLRTLPAEYSPGGTAHLLVDNCLVIAQYVWGDAGVEVSFELIFPAIFPPDNE